MNCNVLNAAPCSVGILIDRGCPSGLKYVYESWSVYRVVVLFFGGADDREALALAERLYGSPTIEVTVIGFLKCDDDIDGTMERNHERNLDDEFITDFYTRTAGNNGVTYMTELVETSFGVIEVIMKMEDTYDLIVLGRHHRGDAELIVELSEWDTCSELGKMADLFTSSGYGGKATILVVEQQTNAV